MFVTNKASMPLGTYLKVVRTCVKAGVTSVQLREKNLPYPSLLEFGTLLKAQLDTLNIPLIINDNVDLCLSLDASGVHLGQTDGDIEAARRTLGPKKTIGLSVNTLAQIIYANHLPIDYIGVGTIFPTHNKPDTLTTWGLQGLQQAASLSRHPIIAIGGINKNNALSVIQAGAHGIAAIGAFHDAAHPYATAKILKKIIKKAL